MKMYAGRRPDESEGWFFKTDIKDGEKTWLIYQRPQSHNDEWVTYKVIADGRVEKKANYWVVKNIKTGQTAYPADMELMKQHRPNLFAKVQTLFVSKS